MKGAPNETCVRVCVCVCVCVCVLLETEKEIDGRENKLLE